MCGRECDLTHREKKIYTCFAEASNYFKEPIKKHYIYSTRTKGQCMRPCGCRQRFIFEHIQLVDILSVSSQTELAAKGISSERFEKSD